MFPVQWLTLVFRQPLSLHLQRIARLGEGVYDGPQEQLLVRSCGMKHEALSVVADGEEAPPPHVHLAVVPRSVVI